MTKATIAVLRAPKDLIFEEKDLHFDEYNTDKFLAKTLLTAISPGTEIAAWRGLPHLREGVTYPRLVGYCNIAKVLKVGDLCEGINPGDIVLTNASHCTHFIQSKKDFFINLPENSDLERYVTSYLFHLGYSTILAANEPIGSSACIVGMGTLGITSACIAQLSGWDVTAISSQKNLNHIKKKISRVSFKSRNDELILGSYKVVVITTNSWEDWDLALKLASHRGKLVVLSFPGRGIKEIPFNPLRSSDFYVKQLKIIAAGFSPKEKDDRGFNFYNEKDNTKRIFQWIKEGTIDTSIIKAEKEPARKLKELYESLSEDKRNLNTYILDWDSFSN